MRLSRCPNERGKPHPSHYWCRCFIQSHRHHYHHHSAIRQSQADYRHIPATIADYLPTYPPTYLLAAPAYSYKRAEKRNRTTPSPPCSVVYLEPTVAGASCWCCVLCFSLSPFAHWPLPSNSPWTSCYYYTVLEKRVTANFWFGVYTFRFWKLDFYASVAYIYYWL